MSENPKSERLHTAAEAINIIDMHEGVELDVDEAALLKGLVLAKYVEGRFESLVNEHLTTLSSSDTADSE